MDRIISTNIRNYDKTVNEYAAYTLQLEKSQIGLRKKFLSYFPKKSRILDLGCGPGRDAQYFSALGYSVVGVDLSQAMLMKAKTVAPLATFSRMDFTHLRFAPHSFEGVWFEAGLLCVPKKYHRKVLLTISTILKANGVLYLSLKEGEGEGLCVDPRYGVERYYAYYSKNEIELLLKSCGFRVLGLWKPAFQSSYHTHRWIVGFCKKK